MSLSVERLKELEEKLMAFSSATINNKRISEEYFDASFAIRELIAIKETKPAVYALDFGNGPDADFCYRTEDEAIDGADGLPLIIGLIRKPE